MRAPALLLLAALLSGACATTGTHIASDYATTLCVTDATGGYGALRIWATGGYSLRPVSGRQECKLIRGTGEIAVWGSTIGGGSMGPLRVRDSIVLDGGCWSWRIENSGTSFPVRCRGGAR